MALICSRCKSEGADNLLTIIGDEPLDESGTAKLKEYDFCTSCLNLISKTIDKLIADYKVQTVDAPAMKLTAKNITPDGKG